MGNGERLERAGLDTESLDYLKRTQPGAFYWWLTGKSTPVLCVAIAVLVSAVVFLPRLTKDTSAEAFIAADHPAVVYRNAVAETFGLSDPVILALVNDEHGGIYNPRSLNLVSFLTEEIGAIDGIDPERVVSIATEQHITGDLAGMAVTPLYEGTVESPEQAAAIRQRISEMPLYTGNLVSEDGTATLIVAELLKPEKGNEVFHAAMELRDAVNVNGNKLYVAGEGAVAEHLSEYVDADALRLYPVGGGIIIAILIVAYRTVRGVALPLLVVSSALAVAMGSMAAFGVPYYIITSAMPIILIAIGVADGIHILGQYYEENVTRGGADRRELVVRTMSEMWHPVFYTSVTDSAGFLALSLASFMPPMRAFGLFAAVGVFTSMVFSLTVLPAILVKLSPRTINALASRRSVQGGPGGDPFGRLMGWVGERVIRHPKAILAVSAVVAVSGMIGATQLDVNYRRIDYFHPNEEIYKADTVMNERFNGTNFIDVVVETDESEGLFNPAYLAKMEAFQSHLESLPHVGGTISVVDYLKQMNRALNDNDPEYFRLPDEENVIAQSFLIYSMSGDPTDFEHLIDYEYQVANIRVAMNSGLYTDIRPMVESAEAYIAEHFQEDGLNASLAGRSNVTYHWVKDLARSHFIGVAAALIAVWIMGAFSFRSGLASLFAIAPVVLAILSIYAAMGLFGIWLGVGTSMFAALGIGISVNFAIHTLDRTLELVRDYHDDLPHALRYLFPSTGRALLFNFGCVFFGFGVLLTSQVPPLTAFGILVAVAVAISFIASTTLLPAMLLVFQPAFLKDGREAANHASEEALNFDEA
jgi:uncharacterized protein